MTQRTKNKPLERKAGKLELTKLLYRNGWKKQKIVDFFSILDWLIYLPKEQDLAFKEELKEYSEDNNVRYVTSIERLGMEEGFIQGLLEGEQKGKQQGLVEGAEETLLQNILSLQTNLKFDAMQISHSFEHTFRKGQATAK